MDLEIVKHRVRLSRESCPGRRRDWWRNAVRKFTRTIRMKKVVKDKTATLRRKEVNDRQKER